MRPLLGSVVDGKDLVEVLWVSLVAGIGVTAVFAFAIVGATRAADLSRDGRGAGAAAFGVVAVVSALGVAAAVVFAIVVMTHKG